MHRYQIRVAAAWHITAELLRRHHRSQRARVILAHPCGGQARQLWVMADRKVDDPEREFFTPLVALSCSDGGVHAVGPNWGTEHSISQGSYIDELIGSDDPKGIVDRVERLAGLPGHPGTLPSSTPPILIARIIAQLAARFVFSRHVFEAECGWIDTAGYSSGVDKRLRVFEWLSREISWNEPEERSPKQARAACRSWLLGCRTDAGHEAKMVLCMDGRAATTDKPNEVVDLWEVFTSSGRCLGKAVDTAASMLALEP